MYRTLTVNWALSVHWTLTVCWVLTVYWMLAVTWTLNIFTHRFTYRDDVKPYNIYGVTVGEVEVDLLTGQHQVSCLWALLLCVVVDCIVMCWGGLYCYVLRWTVLLCVEVDCIVMCWGGFYCYCIEWVLLCYCTKLIWLCYSVKWRNQQMLLSGIMWRDLSNTSFLDVVVLYSYQVKMCSGNNEVSTMMFE